ncbi:MAG TPA: phosphate transport system regulatory protein PhoU [Flavobacteriaceae bacterium]|jgi:phosphate transport system protein|nr:phosphate transport system regulatory protein PhoU [Flavobacteriaceae bacterium]HBS12075.1 phosphate transport system regulatory protein PhoU [Flavobacteriaceae bacterium]
MNTKIQRDSLNQSGYEMLILCKSQLDKAKEAFLNHDSDLAEEVMHTENRVNALGLKIEKDCIRFIALFTPVAKDLRLIMTVLKISSDLERIADHAYNISRYVVDEELQIKPHLFEVLDFEKMYETIDSMFDHITFAYTEKDVKTARKVFKKDKILDKINYKSIQVIETEIKKDTAIIKQALLLSSVIKKLERVGDLIKNIAEDIIFYIDAEVVKHQKKK